MKLCLNVHWSLLSHAQGRSFLFNFEVQGYIVGRFNVE
jgi:hypothetical protein